MSVSTITLIFTTMQTILGNPMPKLFDIIVPATTFLKYGDSCSWENEIFRQNFVNQLLSDGLDAYVNNTKKFALETIENNRKYCRSNYLLICDQKTEKCVCGEPTIPALAAKYPNISTSAAYTEEIVGDKIMCRLSENSICFSKDAIEYAGMDPMHDLKCVQGTTCALNPEGSPCTLFSWMKNLREYYQDADIDLEQFVKDAFARKVCTCQQRNDSNYEEEQFSIHKNTRIKRSLRSLLSAELMKSLLRYLGIWLKDKQ